MSERGAALTAKARLLGPWRYTHTHGDVTIHGDPVAAPIHGAYGRGADIMSHILSGLATWKPLTELRALDLGCLEGHYTDLLCKVGFREVVAVDLSAEHVERARFLLTELKGYTNVTIRQGSIEDADFMRSLGKFDLVLFHGLLYHLKDPVGVFELLREISAPDYVLLLSTQFKFNFAEIVAPSPLANLKFRNLPKQHDNLATYKAIGSTYATMAMRLNPRALYQLLRAVGYNDATSYDTPLGCRYGFQVNLIASTFDQNALRAALNDTNGILGLDFQVWRGDRLDSFPLTTGRSRIGRLIMRVAYSICERIGKSGARQTRRAEISTLGE
jgi:SAM-dependent methyltransferase